LQNIGELTMSTLYSLGSMNQLGDALQKAGFTTQDMSRLKQFKELGAIRDLLSGKASISYSDHIIDTDAAPFIPKDWKLEKHVGSGPWKFDPDSIDLFLSKEQRYHNQGGNKLLEEIYALKGKKPLNANILDYLMSHKKLITKNWKGKIIFFWGTIYRSGSGHLCVRSLYWGGSQWYRLFLCLSYDFYPDSPACIISEN
jgi:hypothetical protein